MSHALEIELKYAAPDLATMQAAYDIFESLSCEVLRRRDVVYTTHYYDTDDLALYNAGVFCRLLESNPPHWGYYAEIKANNKGEDGMFSRYEAEVELPEPRLDLAVIQQDSAAAQMLAPAAGKTLRHIFSKSVARKDIRAAFELDGGRIVLDLCMDSIVYKTAAEQTPLGDKKEIEIEAKLKYSTPSISEAAARAFINTLKSAITANVAGLTPATESKADTGYALYKKLAGKQIKPPQPPAP